LKLLGVCALAACLLEPLWSGQRARPGANLFAIVADNSQGLQVKDRGETKTRAELLQDLLDPQQAKWQSALAENYDVRRLSFDTRLQSTRDFGTLTFQGQATALGSALKGIRARFADRPLAGVLLLTDGNATDLLDAPPDLNGLPPIYPVVIGRPLAICDLAISQVNITQTDFEDAPVTFQAEVTAAGVRGEGVVGTLLDSAGKKIQEATLRARTDSDTLPFRFQFRPEKPGVSFYRVAVSRAAEASRTNAASGPTAEATLLNNSRVVAVDRGRGPYRVLYVAGRPNWEYKFLNRAMADDDQVQLVGLIRVATREGKFDFRGRGGETSNPLFRGFGNQAREDTERYDQPVLAHLNTRDALELHGGFPNTPEELFGYQAVILDDLEAAFFTSGQAALLQKFVSERGGGLLMLGGMESFQQGGYERTPVGNMLPLYFDRPEDARTAAPGSVRLKLTPEGLLLPWARLRETEAEEKNRLEQMPAFEVFNAFRTVKPGATVVATATDDQGKPHPALVTQRFGRGRTAAFTIGDFWRWGMVSPENRRDLDKSWRQMLRWLITDAPKQVELTIERAAGDSGETVNLQVRARDTKFQPLEDASVAVEVQPLPGNGTNGTDGIVHLRADPSLKEPGLYEATYVGGATGAYLARTFVTNSIGLETGRAETGWAIDLAAEEFRSLQPNVALLREIARRTGGELVPADKLLEFTQQLPRRKAPVMEAYTLPAWHTPAVFGFALLCFVTEWGLRRWKGMP
jgi:uncharacterized membrane protein